MTGQFIKPSLLLYCSPYSYLLRCHRIPEINQIPQHRNLHRFYKKSLLKKEFSSIVNKCNPTIHSVLLFSTCSCSCRTHYEVLGVDTTATQKEIKAAYIKLGLKWHPDLHQNLPNDESPEPKDTKIDHEELDRKFKEINEAYEILGKQESRKIYDLSLPRADGTDNGARDSNGHRKGPYRTYYNTPEERGQAFHGYPGPDPDYYKKNPDRWKIAGLCVFAIVFGFFIHFTIAKLSADAHGRYLDQNTDRINKQLQLARESNQKRGPLIKGNEEYNRIVESLKEETELPKFLR